MMAYRLWLLAYMEDKLKFLWTNLYLAPLFCDLKNASKECSNMLTP